MGVKRGLFFALALLLVGVSFFHLFLVVQHTSLTGKAVADDTGVVSLCINHPPSIETISDQDAVEGQAFSLQINASDADGNNLTYYDNTSLFAIDSATGAISFTPTFSQGGIHAVEVVVSDGTGCSNSNASAQFLLTVTTVTSGDTGGSAGGGGGGSSTTPSTTPSRGGVTGPLEREKEVPDDTEQVIEPPLLAFPPSDQQAEQNLREGAGQSRAGALAGQAAFFTAVREGISAHTTAVAIGAGFLSLLAGVSSYLYFAVWNPSALQFWLRLLSRIRKP